MDEDFFISEEDKLTIDLHDMQLLEAEFYLEKLITSAPKNIKEITVVHGYRKGQVLLNMVRKTFKHERIRKKVIPFNPGITIYYLY